MQDRLAAQLAAGLVEDGTIGQREPSGPGPVRFRALVALQVHRGEESSSADERWWLEQSTGLQPTRS